MYQQQVQRIKEHNKFNRCAIFLDRDGVINYKASDISSGKLKYITDVSQIKLYDDIFEPLRILSEDYKIIVITNQSAIGRDYMSYSDLDKIHYYIEKEIEKHGGRIDAFYFCPHKPEDKCLCRKPNTLMVEQAVRQFNLETVGSYMIGDDDKDMKMARDYGDIYSIRLRTVGSGNWQCKDMYEALKVITGKVIR